MKPLIMTHGWPGSFLEFEQSLGHAGDLTQAKAARHSDDPPGKVMGPRQLGA